MTADLVGWAASAVLILTLVQQIVTQSRAPSARGVSPWLFAGQSLASVGFIIYSVLVGSAVFVVTNVCILVTAIVGQVIVARKRRSTARQ